MVFRVRRRSELEKLCATKEMSFDRVIRIRELMQREVHLRSRPNCALILKTYDAKEEWQCSVSAGETVMVLDKLEDGWWLVDKSCGKGRGPFGLVPGIACCWTTVQRDDRVPPPLPPRVSPEPPVRTPPRPKAYTDKDLHTAYAYVARLVNGDGFTAVPPDNFNDLCRNADFADKVRHHAAQLRKRRSRNLDNDDDDKGCVN